MKILVTGAAGFIGSHLAERLAALGHTVRGVDCLTDYYSRELKELNIQDIQQQGVAFYPLDLAEDDLSAVVRDVEFIYHLAAQPGLSATTNLTATHRLLEAAKRSPSFQGFVNISTSSVYGADATGDETTEPQPTSFYGVTKLAAEQLVLAYARNDRMPNCSLRLFSVYGPRERPEKLYHGLIRSMFEDREFSLFEGSEHHLRSYTYVGDIVDGMVLVLRHFDRCVGEIFNIGCDTAITTGEGIRIIEEIIGKPAQLVIKPRRAGDQLKTHANIEKARRVLAYNPTTSAREGLEAQVAWYRDRVLSRVQI
jgi:nucleoside-diphosphate-sugar epimerase